MKLDLKKIVMCISLFVIILGCIAIGIAIFSAIWEIDLVDTITNFNRKLVSTGVVSILISMMISLTILQIDSNDER